MRRGEVYDARLEPVEGSEQGGSRPIIIVSRNAINNSSPLVIAVPCTTYREKRRIYPSQVLVEAPLGGLLVNSIALGEQLRAISKTRLLHFRGVLDIETMERLDRALAIALALNLNLLSSCILTQIVSCNSLVATEKLNLKGMTRKARKGSKRKRQKTGLNRSLLDVGIGNLKSLIQYKVTEAGGFYIEVPTRRIKPSQTCPNCGHQKKKELSERVHNCKKCSYTCDRDVAAAMVMLDYARRQELPSSDVESPTSVSCGSLRKVGALKRRKLVPNLRLG